MKSRTTQLFATLFSLVMLASAALFTGCADSVFIAEDEPPEAQHYVAASPQFPLRNPPGSGSGLRTAVPPRRPGRDSPTSNHL